MAPHDATEVVEGVIIKPLRRARSRPERMFLVSLALLRLAMAERADIYHFHDPELIPIGLVLKLIGKKVVFDVHENVPEGILTKVWIPRLLRKPLYVSARFAERLAGVAFDALVAATPAIARPFPAHKTFVIQNFPFRPLDEVTTRRSGVPVIAYIGVISARRGARQMVEAVGALAQETAAELVIAGLFSPPDLFQELQQLPGWSNSRFLGWLPPDEVAELLSCSSAGLVLFQADPNHIEAQPNKLFEYMSAGVPVICSDFPLWAEIVGDNGCGLTVDPTDVASIAKAMKRIIDDPTAAAEMGRRGRAAVSMTYNWETEELILSDLYQRLERTR